MLLRARRFDAPRAVAALMPHRADAGGFANAFHKLATLFRLTSFERRQFSFAFDLRLAGEWFALQRIGQQKLTIADKVPLAFDRPAFHRHFLMAFAARFFDTILLGAVGHMRLGEGRYNGHRTDDQQQFDFHRDTLSRLDCSAA